MICNFGDMLTTSISEKLTKIWPQRDNIVKLRNFRSGNHFPMKKFTRKNTKEIKFHKMEKAKKKQAKQTKNDCVPPHSLMKTNKKKLSFATLPDDDNVSVMVDGTRQLFRGTLDSRPNLSPKPLGDFFFEKNRVTFGTWRKGTGVGTPMHPGGVSGMSGTQCLW